jgi:hypothetical protein
MGAMIGTGLYIVLEIFFTIISPLIWQSRGVDEAKAFCKGTTLAYREGDDINSFNKCHGSDICSNDWDEVEAAAQAAGTFGWVIDICALLLLIVTMVLIVKKHAKGLNITWKLLAVVPLLMFLNPILQVAVSNPAGMKRNAANEYYVMAAKDILCGNANAGNMGLGAIIKVDTQDKDIKDVTTVDPNHKFCKEVKWVGPPDKTDDLSDSWGRDACAGDEAPAMGAVMPFIWYFVFYLGLLSYLIFNIWSFKEELAGAPKDDTEMGARPAVAVATATPAVAVATATATAAA